MLEYYKTIFGQNLYNLQVHDICLLKTEKTIPMNRFSNGWVVVHQRGTPVRILKIEDKTIIVTDADNNKFYVAPHELLHLSTTFIKEFKTMPRFLYQKKWERKDATFKNFFCFFRDNCFELKLIELSLPPD